MRLSPGTFDASPQHEEAYILVDGVVAQLVERLVRNEKVRGSIPLNSTKYSQLNL